MRNNYLKRVIVCILERKYEDICEPACVRMVLESVHDDPVRPAFLTAPGGVPLICQPVRRLESS